MKTDFKFSNLLGSIYTQGNIIFTPDGNSILSPVGNRVSVFDLTQNTSFTFPFSHRKNIRCLALSPKGNLLLSVDDDGKAILTVVPRRVSIHYFSFKSSVTALAFSPSGTHFVAALGRKIQAWRTPSTPDTNPEGELDFAPFILHRQYGGHFDNITSLTWSNDSRFFLSASKDLTARIWSLDPEEGFEPTVLSGHRESVRNAWFSSSQESIYTVSQDGALFRWEFSSLEDDTDERWRIVQREYFMQTTKLKSASFHAPTNLLTVAFASGLFGLYELPSFANIHTLSLASSPISTVAASPDGAWLAFGSSKAGQLLVWEHASESHILKQSSHLDSLTSLTYSSDSSRVVTGSDNGQIKIWDLQSGFHIATFTEHASTVTACRYSARGNILFTSSLDGSVRAWDMLRYRNFRTFTAPTRLSFTDLALDPSGEIVCASSTDSFDVHLWNVQTGQLLDRLAGHEGPISTLSFSPDGAMLATGSWDRTVRLWNVFARNPTSEALQLTSDLLCVVFRPDSTQIAASSLDGQISFWDTRTSIQTASLDGRRDISGGRSLTSHRTAANSTSSKAFTSLAYSADGTCLLAAGTSKYICLYAINTQTLIKKFTVSINLALSGTQEFLNSALIASNGVPHSQLPDSESASDLDDRIDRSLPGARRTKKDVAPEVRVTGVAFSPTGRGFAAATTEGVAVYSLDRPDGGDFDPLELGIEVTPANARGALERRDFVSALVMAFRLGEGEQSLVRDVTQGVPWKEIGLVVRGLPRVYIPILLGWVGREMESGPHLEFWLRWCREILAVHGDWLRERRGEVAAELRGLVRAVDGVGGRVRRLAERNRWEIEFLVGQAALSKAGDGPDENTNGSVDGIVDDPDGWIGLD